MALDNTLQDCSELPNSDLSDSEIVQDYKKMSKKHGTGLSTGKHKKVPLQPAGPRVLILADSHPKIFEQDPGWDLVAFSRIGGRGGRGGNFKFLISMNSAVKFVFFLRVIFQSIHSSH